MYQAFRERQLQYRQAHLLALDGQAKTTDTENRTWEDGNSMKEDGVNKSCVDNEDPHEYQSADSAHLQSAGSANLKITGIRTLRSPHVYKVTRSFG